MNEFSLFSSASVNGIPLVFVVVGLVQLIGRLGLKGQAQLLSSLLIGAGLGILYQVQAAGALPSDLASWISVLFYGLGLGVVASGLYETGKEMLIKTMVGGV